MSPPMVMVSKLYSRPRKNSSARAGRSGLACSDLRAARKLSTESMRQVDLQPMPAGGLSTRGRPTSATKASASDQARMSRCRAQGRPWRRSSSFICALSRNSSAVAGVVPGMPRASRTWPSWICRGSRMPSTRWMGPWRDSRRRARLDELARVEAVLHLDHVVEELGVAAGGALLNQAEQPYVVELGSGASEPHRRLQGKRCGENHVSHLCRCSIEFFGAVKPR